MRSSNTFPDPRTHKGRTLSLALIALAAFFPHVAQAIDPNRAMSQYIHDRWGTEQGFPRGPVYAITQTTDGYLWIGTEAGLVRFDGWNFRLIQRELASPPLPSVLGLLADNEGNLWLQLPGQGLLRYRNGVFDQPAIRLEQTPAAITAMSLTNRGGPLISMTQRGALAYRGNGFEMVASVAALPRTPVLALAQISDEEIWVGTRDAGLFRLSGGQATPVTKGLPDRKINCLLPDGKRDLWVGTDRGIVRWNGQELTASGMPASLSNFQALALVKDRDANLWIGTDARGLLRFNAQGVSFLGNGSTDAITALFEDREGNLWIGSASGIERLRDSAFVTYSRPEGVPSVGSNPVFVDSESRVWFPSADGGLWWLKDGRHGRVTEAGLERDIVYSIAGGKDELWIGRQRGGLTRLRSDRGSYTAKTYTDADGLAQNGVYSVYQSRDGAVWAGTLSGGVSKFKEDTFTTFTNTTGLASNTVVSILEGLDGTMWFATPNGLSALSSGRWRKYTVREGLSADNVNSLFEDSNRVLWAGTATGLAFLDSGRFKIPNRMPGSLREQILGITEDSYGWLWIATANHVLRVKRDKVMRGELSDGDVREYGLADGLRSVQGVKRHRSVAVDPQGRIWFSMRAGISVVDPARLTNNSAPAFVQIQTISSDGAAMDPRKPIKIQPGHQRLTLGYAGLSLSIPERVRFRYSLEPFDRGWSEPTATREAIYTNLGPGKYRFHVIASNPDGVWNSAEAALGFEIEPVFWQRGVFRLSVLLGSILAALGLYRFRVHQVAKQLNVRFEERLAERTRIAQELHDTLLQGFLSASMQLHVAVDGLSEDSSTKPFLNHILGLMGRVIEEGRNAVRGLRSSPFGSQDLEHAFSLIRQELAIQSDVDFRVIVEGRPRTLNPVIRDEVYRIGREALVNAFRHSGAGNIEVELEYASKRFRVLVRDNGRGMDSQVLVSGREGHWGLPGMRERAETMGANLHVWSSPAGGTEVELSVPGRVAFQSQSSSRLPQWFVKRYRGRGASPPGSKNGRNS